MKPGWIVVREEKHIDKRFWVCVNKEDALAIARDVTEYWKKVYSPNPDLIDEILYEDLLFNYNAEEKFWVYVKPQAILQEGERYGI